MPAWSGRMAMVWIFFGSAVDDAAAIAGAGGRCRLRIGAGAPSAGLLMSIGCSSRDTTFRCGRVADAVGDQLARLRSLLADAARSCSARCRP